MNSKFKLTWLIAIMITAAFSFAACDLLGTDEGCGCCEDCSDTCNGECCNNCTKGSNQGGNQDPDNKGSENITVTVTGNFSSYNGWKASVQLGSPDPDIKGTLAYANYINVTSGTTSLSFPLFSNNTLTIPFTTEGSYFILLWFEKDGEKDSDFCIESKQINKGSNTITFNSFRSLNDDDDPSDLTAELIGAWYPVGTVGDFTPDTSLELFNDGTGMLDGWSDITWTVNGNQITLLDNYDNEYVFVFSILDSILTLKRVSDNKTATYSQSVSGSEWPSQSKWEEYGILGGLLQPAGTVVYSVTEESSWLSDRLTVELYNADYYAFENIAAQLESLSGMHDFYKSYDQYSNEIISADESIYIYHSYTGSIFIIIDNYF
jgi:hypothetical protein